MKPVSTILVKRSTSAIDTQMERETPQNKFVAKYSQSLWKHKISTAVGMPNVLIWAYYFWKNDVANGYYLKDPDTYLRQNFEKLIYRLNQPFLRIDQCAFTNVSIFDRPYLESLFGGVIFPDGSCAIDQIEELIKCQQIFMEVVSEIRDEQMFTFPVKVIAA